MGIPFNKNVKRINPDGSVEFYDDTALVNSLLGAEPVAGLQSKSAQPVTVKPTNAKPVATGRTFYESPAFGAILGDIAQAIAGPHNLSWQARLGALSSSLAKGRLASEYKAGGDLSRLEQAVLGPEVMASIDKQLQAATIAEEGIRTSQAERGLTKARMQEILSKPTFEQETEAAVMLKLLGIRPESPDAPKTIRLKSDVTGKPTATGTQVGEFAYDPQTGSYTKFVGFAPQVEKEGGKPPSLSSGIIDQAQQAAIGMFMKEVEQGVGRKFGADRKAINDIMAVMRDTVTGRIDYTRASAFLTPEQMKAMTGSMARILRAVDAGENFGTVVERELKSRLSTAITDESAGAITIPQGKEGKLAFEKLGERQLFKLEGKPGLYIKVNGQPYLTGGGEK